uniref:Exportin-1 C-terminal domain-containing protein n=1 Tax=Salix viminalis TaxID=40686 RepID=A0A6N2M7Y3_SALVM
MLNVYRMYSELISSSISEGGPYASKTSYVKLLRSVKRETLKLIETFLDKAEDQPQIGKQFVPPMMDPVLGDYARNLPDARESEVLSLFATIINKYKAAMIEDVPRIFEAVFQCTLEASEFCNQFYKSYFLTIEQEIFAVLTDTFHKPGFKLHVLVLQHLFCSVESDALTEPLWDAATVPYPYLNNAMFVREYTIKLLGTSFPNMTASELETLLKFFPMPSYRNLTLQCLTEVAALNFGDFYNMQYVKMYTFFMVQLQAILPPTTKIPEAYANGSSEEQSHIRVLESTQDNISALLMGLEYLINISYVDDTEVFKVCLDYWNSLVLELFELHNNLDNPAVTVNMMGLQMPLLHGMVDGLGPQISQRRQLYAAPMSKLRMLMICRMAKPEEVLIVEDENGNIVRETMKDNDVLVQYKCILVIGLNLQNETLISVNKPWTIKIMRETLIYLSHLDHEDTEKQMLKKLSKQLSGEDWNWNNLNTLCWAIGSISGSMMEEQENRFLVMVIRDLLNLCEITKGKDNKAVIASNIMYVVGQYPRFLRAHWKFLKTDMACDTFLKIVQKCKRKFVIVQVGESEPFVSELLSGLPTTVADLEPHQIHTFYESVGHMIQAESDLQKRDEYMQRYGYEMLCGSKPCFYEVVNYQYKCCKFSWTYFLSQISLIFLDMLNVYRMYSELISSSIAEGGPYASTTSYVKLLRNLPDARESEVLSLFATIINKYKAAMIEDVPRIFEAVFQCTLEASEFCNQFYKSYFLTIEQEIFAVLTDTFHKPGFKLHVLVLQHLFCSVESDALTEPLWDAATVPYPYLNNAMFVREYTIKLLVTQFVNGLFESRTNLSIFKNHIRDFLVQSKEFSAQVKIPHSSKLVDCIKDVDACGHQVQGHDYLCNYMVQWQHTHATPAHATPAIIWFRCLLYCLYTHISSSYDAGCRIFRG